MNGMDVKKVKLREGQTWNTIIYNFEKKKIWIRYFKITKEFSFTPVYKESFGKMKLPVMSWLWFRWGNILAGRLAYSLEGKLKDSRGVGYRILLRKDVFSKLVSNFN